MKETSEHLLFIFFLNPSPTLTIHLSQRRQRMQLFWGQNPRGHFQYDFFFFSGLKIVGVINVK